MSEVVFTKLVQLINYDPDLLGDGQSFSRGALDYDSGKYVFTIESLFKWVGAELDVGYLEFRSSLYKGGLNRELGYLGYKIEVKFSSGNVNTSIYQLVKL